MVSFWGMFGRKRSEERAAQIKMEKETTKIQSLVESLPKKIKAKDVQLLKIEDGDMVIISHPMILSNDALDRVCREIEKIIKEYSGKSVRVVLFEEGMIVNAVLRKGDSEDDHDDFNVKAPKHEYVTTTFTDWEDER